MKYTTYPSKYGYPISMRTSFTYFINSYEEYFKVIKAGGRTGHWKHAMQMESNGSQIKLRNALCARIGFGGRS